ncbi:MAG: CbtB-domain containing protein [Thermoproteota archaeon]|nr:CbtB-domain containing protein [Thermoproteota archaeon]
MDKPADTLYTTTPPSENVASVSKYITVEVPKVSKIAVGILLGVMLFGVFMVGYDQGHLFSIAEGESAFDTLWMHEFYHDMRHAAGFPCH